MDEQPPKKRMGRPPGKSYGKAKNVLLSDEDDELVKALADKLRCSEAAVIRQGIHELAKREGVE